jgi:hypothetical protein
MRVAEETPDAMTAASSDAASAAVRTGTSALTQRRD